MATGLPNDGELWEAFQSGNEEAYTRIYSLHVRAMYRYGMSLVSASEAFVFDCIHDVFAEIWIKRHRLVVPDNVRYYLLKCLKVRILHLLKREERSHYSLQQGDFDDLWSEPSFEDIFTQKEEALSKQEMIKKLVLMLPHRQQEAIRLRFVENLNYEEIGNVMLVNKQSAQNLVFRAVEKLRGWLN